MNMIDKILIDLEELLDLVTEAYEQGEIDANEYDLQVNDIQEIKDELTDKDDLLNVDVNLLSVDLEHFSTNLDNLDKSGDLECLRQFVTTLM